MLLSDLTTSCGSVLFWQANEELFQVLDSVAVNHFSGWLRQSTGDFDRSIGGDVFFCLQATVLLTFIDKCYLHWQTCSDCPHIQMSCGEAAN